eukprot:1786482-Rhodomonas_salina.1
MSMAVSFSGHDVKVCSVRRVSFQVSSRNSYPGRNSEFLHVHVYPGRRSTLYPGRAISLLVETRAEVRQLSVEWSSSTTAPKVLFSHVFRTSFRPATSYPGTRCLPGTR